MTKTRRRFLAECVGAVGAIVLSSCRKKAEPGAAAGIKTIGGPGRSPGRFVTPRAVGVVGEDILVADRSGRLLRFGTDGTYRSSITVVADNAGFPLGVSPAADGGFILTDTHHAKVRFFDRESRETHAIDILDDLGRPTCPQRAVRDAGGRLFLSEFGEGASNRVRIYDAAERLERTFGGYGDGPGRFMRPIGVALTDGLFFVTDISDRIQAFTKDGEFRRAFGKTGGGAGEVRYPHGLAASGGMLYVAEFGNHRIQRFTPAGVSRGTFGRPGQGDGEFSGPWDVAADSRGLLYVADSGNHRIVVIDPARVHWEGGGA